MSFISSPKFFYSLIPISFMTHPLGSIIEHAMLLYRIVPASSCKGCAFHYKEECECTRPLDFFEFCSSKLRDDDENVKFINIGELAFSHSLNKV